jgi:periplasmic protein TonB
MGAPIVADYENVNSWPLPDKTEAGGVEHNGSVEEVMEKPLSKDEQTIASTSAMANDLHVSGTHTATDSAASVEGHELDALLGRAFEEKPIWVGLYESVRDVFFPPKLPPLEVTSKPIPVPDRMAVKTNPWAVGISTTINVIILVFLLALGAVKVVQQIKNSNVVMANLDVSDFKAPKASISAGGGGGGGDHSLVDPSKGKLPKLEKNPTTPPMIPVLDKPKLAMESAINVQKEIQLPDNPNMPNIGVKNSANVKLASNGQGGGSGMGTGFGGGLGSGTGNGWGPGSGGNAGGGLYRIGGSVSSPVVIRSVEAEFSDEARRAKYQGVCLISIIVDAQGNPQNPRVVRALGMGLDEKAIEAIKQYKFRPAMKDGKTPVPVQLTVEVNFRLY